MRRAVARHPGRCRVEALYGNQTVCGDGSPRGVNEIFTVADKPNVYATI
jgi:hypothetical protein